MGTCLLEKIPFAQGNRDAWATTNSLGFGAPSPTWNQKISKRFVAHFWSMQATSPT
jgi:hypothetical protein